MRLRPVACRSRVSHTHADHVSGNRRLAELTGATIHVSAGAGAGFASRPLRAGEHAFDDFAGGAPDVRANKRALGL